VQFPDIWGQGSALFAFSGMDGETDALQPLVGSTLETGRGYVFHTQSRPHITFGVRVGGREYLGTGDSPFDSVDDELVSGSALVTRIGAAGSSFRLECAFLDKDTVGVRFTCESCEGMAEVFVRCAADGAVSRASGGMLVQCAGAEAFATACSSEETRVDCASGLVRAVLAAEGELATFAWAWSADGPEVAIERANRGLEVDVGEAIEREKSFFRGLPAPNTSDHDLARAYYKCASVMKVNCCSAQGDIKLRWTTPDRWPHRWMWIWDSAFHAIGLSHFAPDWAEDAIRAVLTTQRPNGFIPHMMAVKREHDSHIIQPPILAWGSFRVYEKTQNLNFLAQVYPGIGRMIRYDCEELNVEGVGLSQWDPGPNAGGASGMDNSPRFDRPVAAAVDLNAYIVNDMRWLGRIARELGRSDEAIEWDRLADERAERLNLLLWDEETRFYYDMDTDGELVRVKTEAGFTPLFAGVCDAARAEALVAHMTDRAKFWRPFPVSSVSADEPSFSDNMWRGPTWINFNHFFVEALARYGYDDLSLELRRRTLDEVARWHALDGIIYEYYDSEATTHPVFLHRKKLGGPNARRSATSLGTTVCDYNFTAALYIDLLQSG